MIKVIESASNQIVKNIAKLKIQKYAKEEEKFLVEGFHLLEMAQESGTLEAVFTTKELKLQDNIDQYLVNERIIEKLSSLNTSQGVIGVCKSKKEEKITSNLLVYLDDIKDPGNFGTILRTCCAFGIKDILVKPNSVYKYNDKVIMSSQGAIFKTNIIQCSYDELKALKKDYKIYSTSLNEKAVYLSKIDDIDEKIIVVFGNESNGISEEIASMSDKFIKIEISNIDSLNVGVAAGITLYNLINISK